MPGRGAVQRAPAEVGTRDERLETRERGSVSAGEMVLVVAVLLVVVVVGSGNRDGSRLGGPVDVCGGMPVYLFLQQHQDLLCGTGAGYQCFPSPAERGGDGEHHRHVSISHQHQIYFRREMSSSYVVLESSYLASFYIFQLFPNRGMSSFSPLLPIMSGADSPQGKNESTI